MTWFFVEVAGAGCGSRAACGGQMAPRPDPAGRIARAGGQQRMPRFSACAAANHVASGFCLNAD
jgi:hypothetical protein